MALLFIQSKYILATAAKSHPAVCPSFHCNISCSAVVKLKFKVLYLGRGCRDSLGIIFIFFHKLNSLTWTALLGGHNYILFKK